MQLGLTHVRTLGPRPDEIDRNDPDGTLFGHDPALCCKIRKVMPLQEALDYSRAHRDE